MTEYEKDVVEVVRCEYCKHSYPCGFNADSSFTYYCKRFKEYMNAMDFCSYGEDRYE